MVPLFAGVLIILTGLLLNAAGAYWRGQARHWLLTDAAVLAIYVSILASLFTPYASMTALLALAWYFGGTLLVAAGQSPGRALLPAAGELVETLLQLLVNTVSFVRVGAFALAHGGLSMAFNIMADATNSLFASFLLLVLGNLIVMALEGLVVTIQTTRLVLFEFFIRFLQGTGRAFRPLTAPAIEAGIRRTT
jgi:V/A-type H+-transporting ATPase subunit I